MLLDMTPKGRDETGPYYNLVDWVKRHYEYEGDEASSSCRGTECVRALPDLKSTKLEQTAELSKDTQGKEER